MNLHLQNLAIDFMVCKIKRTWRRTGFALWINVTKITKLTRAKYKLLLFRWPKVRSLQMRKYQFDLF